MNVPSAPESDSPWLEIARSAAREWFRDHPGATFTEFDHWVTTHYEPREVLAAGFGINIDDPDVLNLPGPLQDQAVEALDAAHVGLALACEVELGRRRAREAARSGPTWPVEPSAAPGSTVGASPWWDEAQGGAA